MAEYVALGEMERVPRTAGYYRPHLVTSEGNNVWKFGACCPLRSNSLRFFPLVPLKEGQFSWVSLYVRLN